VIRTINENIANLTYLYLLLSLFQAFINLSRFIGISFCAKTVICDHFTLPTSFRPNYFLRFVVSVSLFFVSVFSTAQNNFFTNNPGIQSPGSSAQPIDEKSNQTQKSVFKAAGITLLCSDHSVCASNGSSYTIQDASWDASAMTDCGNSFVVVNFTADPGVSIQSGTSLNGAVLTVGIHTITWTATDGCNNTATCTSTITINPRPITPL